MQRNGLEQRVSRRLVPHDRGFPVATQFPDARFRAQRQAAIAEAHAVDQLDAARAARESRTARLSRAVFFEAPCGIKRNAGVITAVAIKNVEMPVHDKNDSTS